MILVIFVVFWVLLIQPVFALSPPSLSDPPNNSVIYSGPKLSWQAVTDSTGYKVMIDDESSITSPYAKTPYYTNNTYYSPQLNAGNYYWKTGAKDNSGTWFWSDVWSFTLSTSTSTPTPTAAPQPTVTASPTTSSSSASSFTISPTPSQINSSESFTVLVNLSLPNNPDTTYYLSGAFKIVDGTRYFGLTKVNADWISYSSTNFLNQYKITTDNSGVWTGNLEVKPDPADSDYKGTGDYIFKVARYTQAGSQTWSNEANIKIIGAPISDSSSSSSNSSTTPSPSKTPTIKTTNTTTSKTIKINPKIASVAGTATKSATPSANPEVKGSKQINFLPWIGGGFILAGIISLGFIYYRSKKT